MSAPSFCPNCGDETRRAFNGHDSLCLPCTEAELGETYEQIRDRSIKLSGLKPNKRGWFR